MAESLVNYYFFKDALKNLDEKYLKYIRPTDSKIFLKANALNIPKYYKSNKLRSYDYGIKHKLHNLNTKEFLETLCEYTLNNGIDDENLLLLYGIVAEYTIESYINPFVIARSGLYSKSKIKTHKYRYNKNKLEKALDQILFKEREGIDLLKINLVKKFRGGFRFSFIDLNMLDYAINKVYFFPNTFSLYTKSTKLFKFFSTHYKIDFLHLKNITIYTNNFLRSIFSKQFEYISPYTKLKNIDYKNKNNNPYPDLSTGENIYKDFDTLYNEALEKVQVYYDAINKFIFLHNKKAFNKTFTDLSIDTNSLSKEAFIKYSSSIFN